MATDKTAAQLLRIPTPLHAIKNHKDSFIDLYNQFLSDACKL
jgi:hypothetical protein